jgi:hypothetical protein
MVKPYLATAPLRSFCPIIGEPRGNELEWFLVLSFFAHIHNGSMCGHFRTARRRTHTHLHAHSDASPIRERNGTSQNGGGAIVTVGSTDIPGEIE